MRKGRRELIEKDQRDKKKKIKRQKGVEKTIRRAGGGTLPLASACCSASSRHYGTLPKT